MLNFEVMPSMRLVATAGPAARKSNVCLYNCFGEEVCFVTSGGIASFRDFNDGDEIIVLTHMGNWKKAVVRSYGKQQLSTIKLHRGRNKMEVSATANHRWLLGHKNDGASTTMLKPGDVITPSKNIFVDFDYESSEPFEKLYWAYGYVYGDGVKTKYKDEYKYSLVRLCGIKDNKYKTRFEELGFTTSTSLSCNGDTIVYTGKYLKTPPDPSIDSPELIRAFIRGYLDADGEKNTNKNKAARPFISIQSSEIDHQKFIEKCFPIAGVFIHRIDDLTGQKTNYGVRGPTKKYFINNSLATTNTKRFRVDSISDGPIEDVWCLEVDDDHSFVLENGMATGNCAFAPIDNLKAFSELMFILMCGTGVGFSVERQYVNKLPIIKRDVLLERDDYVIEDSREGWADAFLFALQTWFAGEHVHFDYSKIRPYGAPLITMGGRASGPEPLRDLFDNVEAIIKSAAGRKLKPIEVHDICCLVAANVIMGGRRRSAMISFSDLDDEEMRNAKNFSLGPVPTHRYMANNSAVYHTKPSSAEFMEEFASMAKSGSGERGICNIEAIKNANPDRNITGEERMNPCAEILAKPNQFCNLTEVVVRANDGVDDLVEKVKTATWIGVIQASFTHFPYLRHRWAKACEEERLLGVSLTGQMDNPELLTPEILRSLREVVRKTAKHASKKLGINMPASFTCTKPSGTVSQVVDSASGVHPRWSNYYLRRYRIAVSDPMFELLKDEGMKWYPEAGQTKHNCTTAVVEFPVKSPDGAATRHTFTWEDQFNWYLRVQKNWSTHNVSNTIYVPEDSWLAMANLIYENWDSVVGLALFPFDGGEYELAPYLEITEEEYLKHTEEMPDIDFTRLGEFEHKDNTTFSQEIACGGGVCDVV